MNLLDIPINFKSQYFYIFLVIILAGCANYFINTNNPTAETELTEVVATASKSPTIVSTYSLEFLRDKLPTSVPAYGFVLLEMPESVPMGETITVTIYTISQSECEIQYFGLYGLSHAQGLELKVSDANGICSWTWKQSMGDKGASQLPAKTRVNIFANGDWESYFITIK